MRESLTPLSDEQISVQKLRHIGVPDAYWRFVRDIGVGIVKYGTDIVFNFDETLLNASTELYHDREIFELGAKGEVKIFGSELAGISYGFDSGRDFQLVEIDDYRQVEPLDLTFDQFVIGLAVCYPQIPIKCDGHEWFDIVGAAYSAE